MMGLGEDNLSHQSQPPDQSLPAMIRQGIWGLGFKPQRLQATFDHGLPKKSNKNIPSLIVCLK